MVHIGCSQSARADIAMFMETFAGDTATSSSVNQMINGTTVAASTSGTGPTTLLFPTNGVTLDPGAGTIAFASAGSGSGNARGAGFFVDLNGATAGNYEITFDLTGFTAGTAGAMTGTAPVLGGRLYEINGLQATADVVGIDVQTGGTGGLFDFTAEGGNAVVNQIGGDLIFTATGSNTFAFTLANDGVAGDFLGIAFGRDPNGGSSGNFIVDTVSIAAVVVPEPASLALLSLTAFAFAGFRRRRMA